MDNYWDIFIAYSSVDKTIAESLWDAMNSHAQVFLDSRCIRPGDDWDLTLRDALLASKIVLVLVSPSTEEAFFQRDEILRALDQTRQNPFQTRLVPLYTGGTGPDQPVLPYGLKPKQGIALSTPNDLLNVVEQILALVKEVDQNEIEPKNFSPPIRQLLAKLHNDIQELTQEQYRAIQHLRFIRRVRISGTAGSGKTLVAAEKASRLANAGLPVLFLCHNPLLANYVKQLTAGTGVEVADFETWIVELAGSGSYSSAEEWTYFHEPDSFSLGQAVEEISKKNKKYDAIIVDEAQDFRDEWWIPVASALRSDDSFFYIFHDNNQSLLPYRSAYPISEPHIDLSRNCRNAGRVFELMRCFNSSSPSVEPRLREKGKVALKTFQSGNEIEEISCVLLELFREGMLNDTVILWMGVDSLPESPIANLEVQLSDAGPWQEEIRRQFKLILHTHFSHGLILPQNAEQIVSDALSELSSLTYPSSSDIRLVNDLADSFSVDCKIRTRVERASSYPYEFKWRRAGRLLKLHRKRKVSGSIWAAEVILHFSSDSWHHGIPEGEPYQILPFYEPRKKNSIPLFSIPDFKGLEADTIILVMRGRGLNPLESLYVGISRARLLLTVLAEQSSAELLPRSFVWD